MIIKDWVHEAALEFVEQIATHEQRYDFYRTGKWPVGLVAWAEGVIEKALPVRARHRIRSGGRKTSATC